jgi:hypothetical protein
MTELDDCGSDGRQSCTVLYSSPNRSCACPPATEEHAPQSAESTLFLRVFNLYSPTHIIPSFEALNLNRNHHGDDEDHR